MRGCQAAGVAVEAGELVSLLGRRVAGVAVDAGAFERALVAVDAGELVGVEAGELVGVDLKRPVPARNRGCVGLWIMLRV